MLSLAPRYSTVKRLRTLKLQLDVSETNPFSRRSSSLRVGESHGEGWYKSRLSYKRGSFDTQAFLLCLLYNKMNSI